MAAFENTSSASQPQRIDSLRDESEREVAPTVSHRPGEGNDTWQSGPRERCQAWPTIPGYEILSEVGGGGMGIVYRARHLALNRVVALKTILQGGQARQDLVQRFRKEAEAVAQLQHPHIVQIHDFGEAAGVPYFTMELVVGTDLKQALQEKPFPDRIAAALVETLARTMEVVHQRQIIHRDLKPANVLLAGPEQTPKISDFGLAKNLDQVDGQTGTEGVVGTPSYMAPEQARSATAIGPACDVYALGAILYECLVGRPPFKAESAIATLQQVLDQEPLPPRQLQPRLAPDLETICLKCLEKSPSRRYPSAVELADDLRRFLNGEPIQARPAGALERTWKWARRHPRLVGTTLALFFTLVAGVVGTSVGLIEARQESERARQEEQKALALLAATHVQTAQLAAQRGQWRTAITQIDKAIEAGHPDSVALLVQRVKALIAQNDPQVFKDIAALTKRTDLGANEGAVRMLQGDLALITDYDEGARFLRDALQLPLQPADRSFIEGLLAASTPEAVACWEKTLRLDPFHYRANGMLTMALLFQGRLDDAHHRLTVGEHFFPDDPSYQIMRAMYLTLRGDFAGGEKVLEMIRPQLGETEFMMSRTAMELLDLAQGFGEITAVDFSVFDKRMGRLNSLSGRIKDYSSKVRSEQPKPGGVPALHPSLARSFGDIPQAMMRTAVTNDLNPLIDILKRSLSVHPEGAMYYLRGLALFGEGRFYEAEESFLLAASTPALAPVRRNALYHAVVTEGFLASPKQRKPDLEMRKRAKANLRELLTLGPIKAPEAEILVKIARFCDEPVMARQVLSYWESQTPDDVAFLRQKALVELQAEAYGPALQAARRILTLRPADPEALQIAREAEAKAKK